MQLRSSDFQKDTKFTEKKCKNEFYILRANEMKWIVIPKNKKKKKSIERCN